ncbi:MAG: hypothetical protein AAGF98_02290 [Cyanobacteria bacterium P01_H01_bin.153]
MATSARLDAMMGFVEYLNLWKKSRIALFTYSKSIVVSEIWDTSGRQKPRTPLALFLVLQVEKLKWQADPHFLES